MTLTDDRIIATYVELTDGQDTMPQDLQIALANTARVKIETDLKLEICKRLDTSKSTTVGGTYTTSYPLPADWYMGMGYLYVDSYPYRQVPFEQREMNKYNPRAFYIDESSKLLYLCGTVAAAKPITLPYLCKTPDITSASIAAVTQTLTWPDFHMLLPLEMAKTFYAVDAGDKDRAWDDRWDAAYVALHASLVAWDQALKLSAVGFSTPYGGPSPLGDGSYGIPLALM